MAYHAGELPGRMRHSTAVRQGCDADVASSRWLGGGGMPAGLLKHKDAVEPDARNGVPSTARRGGADQSRTGGGAPAVEPRIPSRIRSRAASLAVLCASCRIRISVAVRGSAADGRAPA
jgi:hypothetical protein